MRCRLPLFAFVLSLALGASGCALFAPAVEPTADDAHVVFLTRPDCAYSVVKTQGDRFGILAPLEVVPLRQGDMFVGALRPGQVALRYLPFPEEELGPPVLVDVHAAGLVLADAQAAWREMCGFEL